VSAGRRLDAVIFDNDGLLLDTEESWTRAERILFRRHGRKLTPEHRRELIGLPQSDTEAMFERMLDAPGRGRALMAETWQLVFAELTSYAPPRPGALELIARLQAAGIPLALASNSPRMLVDRALATAQIEQGTFSAILTADVVTHPKPAPEIYLATCAALGTEPARTLVLEDSQTGVAAGLAAGCYTIAVPGMPGVDLGQASLVVDSLASPEITQALGL
jgi:HAD superfamily hydrolase (TIGR01509 family)